MCRLIDGVMYITSADPTSLTDAAPGSELWRFDPSAARRHLYNRGVAYWRISRGNRETNFFATPAGALYSLDARTGSSIRVRHGWCG